MKLNSVAAALLAICYVATAETKGQYSQFTRKESAHYILPYQNAVTGPVQLIPYLSCQVRFLVRKVFGWSVRK